MFQVHRWAVLGSIVGVYLCMIAGLLFMCWLLSISVVLNSFICVRWMGHKHFIRNVLIAAGGPMPVSHKVLTSIRVYAVAYYGSQIRMVMLSGQDSPQVSWTLCSCPDSAPSHTCFCFFPKPWTYSAGQKFQMCVFVIKINIRINVSKQVPCSNLMCYYRSVSISRPLL